MEEKKIQRLHTHNWESVDGYGYAKSEASEEVLSF